MTAKTPQTPDSSSQTGTTYKTNIDSEVGVLKTLGDQLTVYELPTPVMSVRVAAGLAGVTTLGQTDITSIPVPSLNPRIDVIYVDIVTAARGRVQGTEAGSPVLPALSFTQWPLAFINLTPGMSQITNANITNLRNLVPFFVASWLLNSGNTWNAGQTFASGIEIFNNQVVALDGSGGTRGTKFVQQSDDNFVFYCKDNAGNFQPIANIQTGVATQRFNVNNGLNIGGVNIFDGSGNIVASIVLTSPVINSAKGIGQTVWKYKTAAENVSSSTTLQDDDHLVVAMDANASYEIRIDAPFAGSGNLNTCGIKSGVTIPSGASVVNAWMDLITDSHNSVVKQASGGAFDVTTADLSTGGLLANCKYRFYVTTSSTPGNFVFRWAQSTSNGTLLQLPAGSYLQATRVL
jgi:hypothetical protein